MMKGEGKATEKEVRIPLGQEIGRATGIRVKR
jgi:hypothetical protein